MSANNFLMVSKLIDEGLGYAVDERDIETGEIIGIVGQRKTLKSAIYLAQEYQNENEVEYGIQFDI